MFMIPILIAKYEKCDDFQFIKYIMMHHICATSSNEHVKFCVTIKFTKVAVMCAFIVYRSFLYMCISHLTYKISFIFLLLFGSLLFLYIIKMKTNDEDVIYMPSNILCELILIGCLK